MVANRLRMTVVQSILSIHAQRWSQRRIASALGIDRATVRRRLRQTRSSFQADPAGISNAAIAPIDPGRVVVEPNAAIAPTGSEAADAPPPRSARKDRQTPAEATCQP